MNRPSEDQEILKINAGVLALKRGLSLRPALSWIGGEDGQNRRME